MTEQQAGIGPFPSYLDEVERLVGLPFYSDQKLAYLVRSDPAQVEHSGMQMRRELYLMVQYAITGATNLDELSDERLASGWDAVSGREAEVRHSFQPLIHHVRGELMEADEGLKTPAVLRLEEALKAAPLLTREKREKQNVRDDCLSESQLPAYATTVRSIGRIVDISRSNAVVALRRRHVGLSKIRLPGMNIGEYIVPWPAVARLGDQFGLVAGVEIDFTALPDGPDDIDTAKIDYARTIHKQTVPLYKLTNIPGVVTETELAQMKQPPRPYELTVSRLEQLLGGGYHFLEEYLNKNGLSTVSRRHPLARRFGEFIMKEVAAEMYAAYTAIPRATSRQTSIATIARETGVVRRTVLRSLTDEERAALMQMRALNPAGRVLDHLPNELVANVKERISQRTIPPSVIPINRLPQYLPAGHSALMKITAKLPVHIPKLLIKGSSHRQSCCDWHVVELLETIGGRRDGVEPITYDMLPRDYDDDNPDRIVYARSVQERFGLEIADENSDSITAFEAYPELCELPPDVQNEIGLMADANDFTEKAVIRLLIERGIALNSNCSKSGMSALLKLKKPPDTQSLSILATSLKIDTHEAVVYLKRRHRTVFIRLNRDGYPEIYIDSPTAELLRQYTFAD